MSEPRMPPEYAPTETRISTLIGDRLCIQCGYNLVGQPILRESHYDMLILRCPECATVASVQEYPLLGRWANRWAALLAALWLLVVMALWLGTAGAIFGLGVGSAELAADHYGEIIYERFTDWQNRQAANAALSTAAGSATVNAAGNQVIVYGGSAGFTAWWQSQDRAGLLRDAGGVFGGFNWWVWFVWMWLAIVGVILGVMWATVLIARSRPGLLLWCAIITATAGAIAIIPISDWLSVSPGWTHRAAQGQIGPLVMVMSLGWGAMWLAAGMMLGRPIARGLVRLMLPPRMRSALAFLWLTDGLDPPRARPNSIGVARRV